MCPKTRLCDDIFTDWRAKTGGFPEIFHYKLISTVKIHRRAKTDFEITFTSFLLASL